MSGFYELVGRVVVGLIRWRYGDQIRNAALAGLTIGVLAALGAYLAGRDGEEA